MDPHHWFYLPHHLSLRKVFSPTLSIKAITVSDGQTKGEGVGGIPYYLTLTPQVSTVYLSITQFRANFLSRCFSYCYLLAFSTLDLPFGLLAFSAKNAIVKKTRLSTTVQCT